jgi:hypothetical protein
MTVTYHLELDLSPDEFIDVLIRSTLAERRPIKDAEAIRGMLRNADVIVTARQELIRRTHEAAGLHTTLILLAAPKAQAYYPHIGMTKHESCWINPPHPT